MKTKEATLVTFVKEHCTNFSTHYQLCSDDEPCRVLNGERCGHFEKKVLGPPDYKYRVPGIDYAKLFAQYAQLTGAKTGRVIQRRCECGAPLNPRQRFCQECKETRRKQTYRKSKNSFRRTIRGHLNIIFSGLKHRCNSPKSKSYKYYGGRGIQNKFKSFEEFYNYVVNDLKTDPRGLTIDRIDNDGHYEKGNIRFVSHVENCKNRKQYEGGSGLVKNSNCECMGIHS